MLAAASLLVPGAGATTGTEIVVPVKATLTDSGVRFVYRMRPNTQTTFLVTVRNRSTSRRTFSLGFRKTRMLPRGTSQTFFYSFQRPGRAYWRSTGAGGKTYRGFFRVRLAPNLYTG